MDLSSYDLLLYSGIGLVGLCAFIISLSLMSEEEKFKAMEKIDETQDSAPTVNKNEGIILKYSRPLFKRYISPIVGGMKVKHSIRKKYKQKLANAGLTNDLTPDDFYSFKLFLILAFPVLYVLIREFGEFYDWPIIVAPFTGIFGYFYPDIWMSGRVESRKEEIIISMPFIVDLLALSIEAGLDFVAAINKVVEKAPRSALVEEFEIFLKEIKVGSNRAEGLRGLSYRTNVLEIASFSATLIAADSVGANIGPILKVLAGDMRMKKSASIEKKGAQAVTKILGPIMLFILPSIILIIMAPIGIQFITGDSGAGGLP